MLNSKTIGSGNNLIIFIHGNSQSLHTWDAVVDSNLLSSFTLIAVDLPGHGDSFKSSDPKNDYTFKGCALHLVEFLQQFNDREYIIVANSLGTTIFAEAFPMLKGCVGAFLIGACIIGQTLTPADILLPDQRNMLGFLENPSDEQLETYLDVVVRNKNDLPAREQYKVTFLGTDKVFRPQIVSSIANAEWTDHFINIGNLPVALVYGDEEEVVNARYLENISLNKWKDKIIMVAGAGHSVQIDQPVILANMIADFAKDYFKLNHYES